MGLWRCCAVLLGVACLAPGSAWAGHVSTHVTLGNDRQIQPATTTVNPGDTVTWEWVGPDFDHSTSAFPSQLESWDSDPSGNNINHPPDATGNFTFPHTFDEPGTYTYRCRVHPDRMQGTVKVRGIPTASFTATPSPDAPNPPFTDQTVNLDASASFDDLGGSIVKYEWDLDGNLTNGPLSDGFELNTLGVPTTSTSFATPGTRTLRLRVTDNDTPTARTNVTTRSITIRSRDPVANFNVSANPQKGQEVTFTSTSTDPDDTIVNHEWDLDGDPGTGPDGFESDTDGVNTATATYTVAGQKTVRLRVTDAAVPGHTATATRNFTVANQLPTAVFTATPSTVLTGETVNFDAADSTDVPPGAIVSYAWDLDGNPATGSQGFEVSGASLTTSTSYATAGARTTRLRVTDDDGGTSITTRTVAVNAPTPPPTDPPPSNPPPSDPAPQNSPPAGDPAPALPAPSVITDSPPVLPPAATVAGPARQRALRQRGIRVTGGCDRACTLAVRGTINVPGASKVFRLRLVSRSLSGAGTARVKLALPRAAQRAIRSALRRRKRVTATITVAATDASGTSTRTKRVALIG